MNETVDAEPVVVGIDGSKPALRAARWAAVEAASRDATLRLVYVIESDESQRQESIDRAQHALHKAWVAISDSNIDVKVESEIASGRPADCLVEESRHASMVCMGHRGTHDSPDGPRGSTAAEVAQKAVGSVAIVHAPHTKRAFDRHKWIIVVLDESDSATAALKVAQNEAVWRHSPILVLESWSHSNEANDPRHPVRAALNRLLKEAGNSDVQSVTLPRPSHMTDFLQQSASIDQLVIVAGDHAGLVEELTNGQTRKVLDDSDCSLLFAR
ncbi:nucleotide-binding universal stress UspA family protein [Mycobacterium sp. MAA66]|uniref:universal stress protein n=1 Tax=Mycobacterium sp. MAA66 TaxID=3156297 RepID=UPI003512DA20